MIISVLGLISLLLERSRSNQSRVLYQQSYFRETLFGFVDSITYSQFKKLTSIAIFSAFFVFILLFFFFLMFSFLIFRLFYLLLYTLIGMNFLLISVLAIPSILNCSAFLIIHLKYILIFIIIFSLIKRIFRNIFLNIQIYVIIY